MAYSLTDALLKRASQWNAFHKWEQNRPEAFLTIGERVAWYVGAFSFVARSLEIPISAERHEKTDLVRHIQSRLKYLKRSNRNG
jgi:hypothetical protein